MATRPSNFLYKLPSCSVLSTINIFVYGTLKPGELNYQHYCASKVLEAKRAIAFGKLFALPLGYPAMTSGKSLVRGFLLSFADTTILGKLDLLEGFDPSKPALQNEYNRQLIETYNPAFVCFGLAWVYLMTPKQVQYLSGVFLPDGWWSGCRLYPAEPTHLEKFN